MERQARILLVDDEEGVRFMLGALLKEAGYLVAPAACRAEAMAAVASNGGCDVAFVDISLKGESGIDILRAIKEMDAKIPVIMFTGNPNVESASHAVRLGAFDYLLKPVRHETLLTATKLALTSRLLEAERELNRANQDAILRSVADAIIMIDDSGHLVQFNAAAAETCGFAQEHLGRHVAELSLRCSGTCMAHLLHSLHDNEACRIPRMECRQHNGAVRLVSFTATPVQEADASLKGFVAAIRDETRIDLLEKSLEGRSSFFGIIGGAPAMQKLYTLTEALADVQSTVLITGESGTGKELFAAALHNGSSRSKGPFVKVNCAALAENLLESELFGHVKGAFTGAIATKIGRFEKAHGGTLFLDEIGDISSAMQVRLLRVLQECEFERVGDSQPIKVDVRVVVATHRNLAELVKSGSFRQDLYYRINVVKIHVPPLRDRVEDIPRLARHFLATFNRSFGKTIDGFSDQVMALLLRYHWPGNVRELQHVIEHATLLCKADTLSTADLPQDVISSRHGSAALQNTTHSAHPRLTLEQALVIAEGNKAKAARLLGISRRTIYRHLDTQ